MILPELRIRSLSGSRAAASTHCRKRRQNVRRASRRKSRRIPVRTLASSAEFDYSKSRAETSKNGPTISKFLENRLLLSNALAGVAMTTMTGFGDGGGSGGGWNGGGGGNNNNGNSNSPGNALFDIAAADEEDDDDDDDDDEEGEEYEEETDEEEEEEEGVTGEGGEAAGSEIAGQAGEDDNAEEEESGSESESEEEQEEVKAGGKKKKKQRRSLDSDADLASNEFNVAEIITEGLPQGGEGVPTKEELFAGCRTQPGYVCTRGEIVTDAKNFRYSGVFQDVQARTVERDGKTLVVFKFVSMNGPPPKSLDVVPHKLSQKLRLPKSQIAKARRLVLDDTGPFDSRKMFQLKHCLEDWYRKQGLSYCYVTQVDGMETGKLKVRLLEGKVGKVSVSQVNLDGKPTGKPGNIPAHIITRAIPFKEGEIYHQDMPQKILRDVFGLGLFETMSVGCKQSRKDETKFDIELAVKERPVKTADLEFEWPIAPSRSGRPGLATKFPGGSLTWENGNIDGKGSLVSASASTGNFLDPSEDLGYQLTYRRPDIRGIKDPRQTEFNASIFNTRNPSAVFAPAAGKEEVASVVVDRVGGKFSISEKLARNSKLSYGFVLQQVSNLDESGAMIPNGAKALPTHELDPNGPPTSLSGTGKDRLGFLQGNLTRDNTYFLNGTQLGNRQIFQVEQGVGLGSDKPFFNRMRMTATHFHELGKRKASARSKRIPRSVVLHGRAGACFGDQPPYELFTLGGPFSVRGYQVGEIAAARFALEAAAELRIPWKGKRLYTFAEGASDLGTSGLVLGNPTKYFDKPGSAFSLGAGVKLGAARLECATEGLAKPTVWNVRFGERF